MLWISGVFAELSVLAVQPPIRPQCHLKPKQGFFQSLQPSRLSVLQKPGLRPKDKTINQERVGAGSRVPRHGPFYGWLVVWCGFGSESALQGIDGRVINPIIH